MRSGLRDSGWAGSLFDEPIEHVKLVLSKLQFLENGPHPEDAGVLVHYAHETWVRFLLDGHLVEEFESTDKPIGKASDLATDMKAVDDARAAAGDLPLARCSVENGIRTYEDPELWPDKAGLAASVGWAQQTCENNRSAHRGQACMPKNLNCPRGDGAGYCGFEMKQYEADDKELKVKAMIVDPETETIADLAKRLTQTAGRDGEKILEKLYGVSLGMTAAAAVDSIKIGDSLLTDDKVAIFLKNEGHLGTRAQRRAAAVELRREVGNWSAWHREPTAAVERKDYVDPETGIQTWCKQRQGHCLKLSCDEVHCDRVEPLPDMHYASGTDKMREAPVLEPPVVPAKKVPKPKKSSAASRANRNRDLEAAAPHGCLGASPCLCHSCINQETCGQCKRMNKSVCGHYHAHTMECPAYSKAEGEGWTCSDCLCPKCANNGESCHTCEGPIYCSKHGGKMGGCPDFRAKDGKEEACQSTKELTVPVKATKQPKPKKQPKLTRADYDNNPLPGSNADTCAHCDCETCGLNQAHLNYTDKEWASCPPCGCDQCLGKPELQATTLCGRKAALTAEVLGNTESQLPAEQQHMVTLQRYVRQFCGECKCLTCGRAYQNCAMNGDEPYHICSICILEHAHHHKPYPAIIKDCEHWIDKATFSADIYAPGQGPCPETACELRYNGEGGPCLCHSCKHGPGSCDTSCNIPGYPMETGQYGCEWYTKKDVATVEVVTQPAAELDVPDLVKVGDLVTRLHTRGYVYDIHKVTRVEKTDAGWQICGDRWDDFRHPKRKNVSKNEPIIRWDVTGWKAEEGKVVPLREKVVEGTFGAKYNEKYADEQLIVLTLEQVEQLVAVEEAEDVNGPTNYTRVYLKLAGAKGTLNDLHSDWPLLGHARFVDTSAAAVAKIPSGRRSEVCQDEPECEHCLCKACEHQKACRLDNTLNCCSPCKTSGGAHHHKAVDCEGHVTLEDDVRVVDRFADGC